MSTTPELYTVRATADGAVCIEIGAAFTSADVAELVAAENALRAARRRVPAQRRAPLEGVAAATL